MVTRLTVLVMIALVLALAFANRWRLPTSTATTAVTPTPTLSASGTLAYAELANRAAADQNNFYVYQVADSGLNHGFPSGLFGSDLSKIHLNAACIDDPTSSMGCSTNLNSLDQTRGTVMQVTFDPLTSGQYLGLNIEEPENWGVTQAGVGYNLTGATRDRKSV